MKVPMAWCLKCGWTTQDLDELDAHTASCIKPAEPEVRKVACSYCGAQPGEPCVTTTIYRIPVNAGNEHTDRWKAVSLR